MAAQTPAIQWLAIGLIAFLLCAGILTPNANRPATDSALQPPSSVYWMGTDELGRDVAYRTLRAGTLALIASVLA